MEIALDRKTIAVAAIAVIAIVAILVFVVFPQQAPQGGAASPTPSVLPTASAAPAAAAKNLDPSSYKDSTASFIVELANAINKMVA